MIDHPNAPRAVPSVSVTYARNGASTVSVRRALKKCWKRLGKLSRLKAPKRDELFPIRRAELDREAALVLHQLCLELPAQPPPRIRTQVYP